VWFIARDHDDAKLDGHIALLRRCAEELVRAEPRAQVDVEVREQYRNMVAGLAKWPEVAAAAEAAIRRAGVEPVREIVRGGTDGAFLTALGLPTPNIFTGGQLYHSVREWASVQDMAAAAATAVELARVWAE
jgi:tripeptide aminopeptidase